MIHTGATLIFTLTAVLIVPFVQVYTHGVNDADYMQPLFGVLLVVANSGHCLRLPYNIMILAAGHYKQTQHNYIIAAVINIVISIICVKQFGLIGVTLGTLAAMVYQTIWMAWYNSKNFICWPMKNFWKQIGVDIVSTAAIFWSTSHFTMQSINYFSWIILAIKVTIVGLFIIIAVNTILYPRYIRQISVKVAERWLKR